jgi:hypothetical protein
MTLRQTASVMRQGLDLVKISGKPSAWIMRTLPRGLQMLLSYEGDRWRLALRREDVMPSEDEVDLCSLAFGVPDAAGRHNFKSKETAAVTHRRIMYHVVELTWREDPAGRSDDGLSHFMATFAPVEGPDSVLAPGAPQRAG